MDLLPGEADEVAAIAWPGVVAGLGVVAHRVHTHHVRHPRTQPATIQCNLDTHDEPESTSKAAEWQALAGGRWLAWQAR